MPISVLLQQMLIIFLEIGTMCMGIFILASCPAGSLAAVLARQYDLEGELASQAVAQSTLFIVISIPALLTLAGTLFH